MKEVLTMPPPLFMDYTGESQLQTFKDHYDGEEEFKSKLNIFQISNGFAYVYAYSTR
jgi:hypothetical protein